MSPTRILSTALICAMSIFSSHARASSEDVFWSWFRQNDAVLFDFESDQEATFDRLAAEMHKVDPNLTFEFGPKEGGRREFVISADGVRATFPKVESLFAAAPALPHWKVVKFRPRRAPADIEYKGMKVDATKVAVVMEPQGAVTNVTVLIPGCSSDAYKTCQAIAFLLLDQALGEYDVETKIGRVSVREPSVRDASSVPLRALPMAFDAMHARR